MGWFDSTTTSNSKSSGTATTGITGTVLDYANSLGGIFNPSNYANLWAGINPYQSAAAANQQGLSGGLMPAYNQALSIGATGIDPNRIAAFYNPATQGMVDATNRSLDRTDAIGRARNQAWMAKQGALGGTQGRNNRMMGDFTRDQSRAAAIAGLYNDAWSKAAGLAGQSAGLQLSGLGAAGTLSGAQSGLNQNLFQMGSGIQALEQAGRKMPLDAAQQGAQTYAGVAPATGQYTTGKMSGSSTTSVPIGSVVLGGIGAGLSALPAFKADGGGVMAPYSGNSDAKDPHSRLMKAFHSIRGMMRSNGGPVIKPFAYGGDVGLGSWDATVSPPSFMDKLGDNSKAIGKAGSGLAGFAQNMQKQGEQANSQALSSQQSGLSQMMSGMMLPMKGFAAGGSPRVDFGRKIYEYFLAQGLPPHQAAAVAGNMAWESGGRADLVNPGDNWRNSPRAPHSIGIAQWNDRSPALVEYAKSQGIEIPDGDLRDKRYAQDVIRRIPLEEQLKFAWNEMQGPERRAYDRITRADDLYAGTAAATGYHRPAGWTPSNPHNAHGLAGRYDLAQKILNSTGGDRPVETPATSGVAPFSSAPQPPDGMDATSYASKSVIPAYAAAGPASPGNPVASSIAPYAAAETASPITPPADPAKEKSFGDTMKSFGSKLSDLAKPQENVGAKALAEQQSALSRMLAGMMLPAKGFASGGTASGDIEWVDGQPVFPSSSDAGPSYAGGPKDTDITSREPGVTISPLTPSSAASRGPIGGAPPAARSVSPAASSSGFNWKAIMPFQGGVWNGEPLTPLQRAGALIALIGNGPFASFGSGILEMNKHRLEQQKVDQSLGALMGRFKDGTPTFEAQEKSGLISLNGKMVPTLDKQKLDETSRLHDANIALIQKQTENEGLRENRTTGEYYSSDPRSPLHPLNQTPNPDSGMAAALRKAWATKHGPERVEKLGEAYNTANDTVNKFNDMEALLPHIVSGKWANMNLEARKALSLVGVGDPTKVSATELARTLSQTLVLDATKNLKPATDLDLKFTQKATATIENDPATLQVLLPALRAVAQRAQLKAELERKEILATGKPPDTIAIDRAVDEAIPSPIQKYAEFLKLGGRGDATARPAPASAPIEPPQDAVNMLLNNASDPVFIASFNKKFNAGKPGLAEAKIAEAKMSKVGSAPQPPDGMDVTSYAQKSAGPTTPDTSNENAPHNLLRRLFGQNPI